MSDKQQVRDAGIEYAVIIDDGYDEIPQVTELIEEEAWDSFFDDCYGEGRTRVQAVFPEFEPEEREELKNNQDFINALWQHRDNLEDLLGELFDAYQQKTQEIKSFLEKAESALDALGIRFDRCGRDFIGSAVEADLIVIDLFLGIQQGERERELTVERLKQVVDRRGERPLPSIILMSQVPGVGELAKQFRQDVRLHASSFRHIRKSDLGKTGRLEGLILTLAAHRDDSRALARFVETWEANAIEAARTAANTLRKIDIDDLQHIRSMLLRFEGLNTSSYILDVFDRVLQYQIEAHRAVLDAAVQLDEVADDPAPLMVSNDRDTYSVLEQTLFVNPNRRQHSTGAEWPIAFGDILGPKAATQIKPRGFFSGREDLVFFVASPECDLIRRDGLTTALLVAGTLKKIDMAKPDLAVTSKTTPILVLNGDERFQVDWDFGDLRTISLDRAKRLLHRSHGDMSVVARLREGPALNLRQQLLSNVGRVGELAPLPRSFRFRAALYYQRQEGGIQRIELPDTIDITGNVLVPRPGRYAAAIIDSNHEDDITEILLDLDLNCIERKSRKCFQILQNQSRIRQLFRSGLQGFELPLSAARNAGLLKLEVEQPTRDSAKPKIDKVATIVDESMAEAELEDIEKEAGLILRLFSESNE